VRRRYDLAPNFFVSLSAFTGGRAVKIRLNEIPQDGRQYDFDRKSGELDEALEDLIGKNPYQVGFFIKPIGNAYELRGQMKTVVHEVCASCGYDFDLPLERKMNEILFEEPEENDRKGHSVHGNQSVDFLNDGPGSTPYKGDVFDAGDFVHEMVALNEPLYPMCGENGQCKHAEEVSEIRRRLENEWLAAQEKKAGNPAFSVLKTLELDENKN
jgi:uncharacterized protein